MKAAGSSVSLRSIARVARRFVSQERSVKFTFEWCEWAKKIATTIYEKFVSMLCLLQVNEGGHIPYGKKRAFILTIETRLFAFI